MTDLLIMVGGIGFALGLAWLLTYAEAKLRGPGGMGLADTTDLSNTLPKITKRLKTYRMMERHEELDIQGDRQWRQR